MPVSKKRKGKKRKKRKPLSDNHPKLPIDALNALGISEHEVVRTSMNYKISALFGEFAADFLEQYIDDNDYVERVRFAAMAWNIGLVPKEDHETDIQRLIIPYDHKEMAEDAARVLIRRKIEQYGEYKHFIVDTNVVFKGNDKVNLTVHALLSA